MAITKWHIVIVDDLDKSNDLTLFTIYQALINIVTILDRDKKLDKMC